MKYTSNLNLKKPEQTDYFDQENHANYNMDVIDSTVASHLADYVRQPGYGTTGGSENAYTLTLDPTLTAYTPGVCVAVKIHAANTGVSTINVNGLGAKSIRDSKGNTLTSGKLVLNSVYTLRYDGTNFILQGEGGEYGTAGSPQVLTGYTIGTDAGIVNGSMPNRGTVTITPSNSNQAISAGYHNGSGIVSAVTFDTSKVLSGTTIAGTAGAMPNRGTVNYTPGTSNQTISQGYHSGSGVVYGSSNLIASNIKFGVNIFGVSGTSIEGKPHANGSLTINNSSSTITVSGLSAQPSFVLMYFNWYSSRYILAYKGSINGQTLIYPATWSVFSSLGTDSSGTQNIYPEITFTNNGFIANRPDLYYSSHTLYWFAIL